MTPTPAAELAEMAADCIGYERQATEQGMRQASARAATRDTLADRARELGIPEPEIEAAVDAAIKAASGAT